jgi:Bacterial PH domain
MRSQENHVSKIFRVAPFGTIAWVWTLGFIFGILFFGVRAALDISAGRVPEFFDVGATVILLALTIYGWMRSVRRYNVNDSSLVVERAVTGKVQIPYESIKSVTAKPDLGSFFNTTIFSIGGLFGWADRVEARKPRDTTSLNAIAYGTNPENSVLLELDSGRVLILTPADPQAFVAAMQEAGVGANSQRPLAGKWTGSTKGSKRKR